VKRRALLEFALHFDLAAMFLNYSVDDRQSQAGAVIFCAKKRIENMGDVLAANSFARVADGDAKDCLRLAITMRDRGQQPLVVPDSCPYTEFTASLHRIHGVNEKVEENLFELVGIGAYCINIGLPGTN